MNRVRESFWIVVDTDAKGNDTGTSMFTDGRRARATVKIWKRIRPSRCYSDPTRVTVLLKGATP